MADISGTGGSYVTDASGITQIDVAFDPVLAGHTVTLSVHSNDGNRTGTAKVASLRWDNYSTTSVFIDNDGSDHNVTLSLGINNIDGDPLESLIGVDIVPSGIISDSGQCELNTSATHDLNTNANGQIRVQISTSGLDPDTAQCSISWSTSGAHIYREY